ncbi:hypothetical protein OSTOST_23979 [Ostertagia ostertagi]
MFADDIKIYATYDQYNCGMIRDALKCSFQKMTDWALQWDIPLNLSKSMVMHIGDTYPVDYYISANARDLGVLLDPRLKFSLHIDHAVKKAFTNFFYYFVIYNLYSAVFIRLVYCHMLNIVHKSGAHVLRRILQKSKKYSVYSHGSYGTESHTTIVAIIYPVMKND